MPESCAIMAQGLIPQYLHDKGAIAGKSHLDVQRVSIAVERKSLVIVPRRQASRNVDLYYSSVWPHPFH